MSNRRYPGYSTYEPEIAAALLQTQPEECWLSLEDVADFISVFGLGKNDLKKALAAGTVQANGVKTATGYKDIQIRADGLQQWLKQMNASASGEDFERWMKQPRPQKRMIATGRHRKPKP